MLRWARTPCSASTLGPAVIGAALAREEGIVEDISQPGS
jgi:hypothetical protein